MAVTLPTQYRLTSSTAYTEDTGVAVDMTDDGASAARDLYANSYFNIDAEFGPLTGADHAGLMGFLRYNRMEEIDVKLDGSTFRCRIVRAPAVKFFGGFYRQVTAGLRGYAL